MKVICSVTGCTLESTSDMVIGQWKRNPKRYKPVRDRQVPERTEKPEPPKRERVTRNEQTEHAENPAEGEAG